MRQEKFVAFRGGIDEFSVSKIYLYFGSEQ